MKPKKSPYTLVLTLLSISVILVFSLLAWQSYQYFTQAAPLPTIVPSAIAIISPTPQATSTLPPTLPPTNTPAHTA
ncbi:MAG: hypothetical protein D6706_09130, partial [Chloroflexi bacterium]